MQSILEQSSAQGSAESHLRFPHHWVFLRPGRRRPTTCVSCSIFTLDTYSEVLLVDIHNPHIPWLAGYIPALVCLDSIMIMK